VVDRNLEMTDISVTERWEEVMEAGIRLGDALKNDLDRLC